MATITKRASGSFRARVRRKGMKSEDRTFETEAEAIEWGRETEAKIATGLTAHSKDPGSLDIGAAWLEYQNSIAYNQKAAGTRKREAAAIKAVIRLIGEYALSSLTAIIVQREFIDVRAREKSKKDKCIQGDTIRLEEIALSNILKWAKKRGIVLTNCCKGAEFEIPKLGKREERIHREQEEALMLAALIYNTARAGHDLEQGKLANWSPLAWLKFTMATGTRPGEAAKIKLSWINEETAEIHVPSEQHKTRVKRIIIVQHGSLTQAIQRAKAAKSKFLFYSISRSGVPTPLAYSGAFVKIRLLAGLSNDTLPHTMRHEYISRLFETTSLSDSQIAALVGDEDTASLRRYTHLRTS